MVRRLCQLSPDQSTSTTIPPGLSVGEAPDSTPHELSSSSPLQDSLYDPLEFRATTAASGRCHLLRLTGSPQRLSSSGDVGVAHAHALQAPDPNTMHVLNAG